MKTLRLIAILILFLAGCAAPTALPTDAVTQPTATLVVVASATAQPSATATLVPTVTLQPTAIPATSTPDALQTQRLSIDPLVAPCAWADGPVGYSPNKTWALATCQGSQPGEGTVTKLARLDGSQQWSISFSEIFLKPYRAGDTSLLRNSFILVRWTKNEDFAYLAVQTSSADDPYRGYDGLFRLNLSTGKVNPVLKPSIATSVTAATYAFQYSYYGNKLAYINQAASPVVINIIDSATGEESKITLDARFRRGGSLLWSSDEKKLVVSVMDDGANGGNSVILYDLETSQNTYLVQKSPITYLPFSWNGTGVIYAEKYPGNWVFIDALTGEISPAPAP